MSSTKTHAVKNDAVLAAVPMYSIGAGISGLGASCGGGTEECLNGLLATADVTEIHDELLSDATRLINRILQDVAQRRPDRGLKLFNVGGEVLLCWTTPDLPKDLSLVSELHEVRRVLKIKDTESSCSC